MKIKTLPTIETIPMFVVSVALGVATGLIAKRVLTPYMGLTQFLELLKIVIWPIVALVGIFAIRPSLAALLSGSKVKLSLFGQSIETTLPELGRIIEEQTGGILSAPQIQYLDELHQRGLKEYSNKPTPQELKLLRPLRDYGLIMTSPYSFLADAAAVQLTSLGRLYMTARKR
jgi:hypothetical protein